MRAHILSLCFGALALAACGAPTDTAGAQSQGGSKAAGGAADLSGLPPEYQNADLANGRQQWFLCAACHQIADGNTHGVGPDLHGIFGRKAGTNPTFPLYTPAMKEAGWTWDPAMIDKWITDPRAVLPTTTMIFPGLKDPDDRRDVIAYLWVETNKGN